MNINRNTIVINNYPIINELSNNIRWQDRDNEICYIGGIAEVRGIKQIVKSLEYVDNPKLNLAGIFNSKKLKNDVKNIPTWAYVNDLGFINRDEVANILMKSKIGLVTLHPTSNFVDSLPVKMFEYMAAGLPVISSNFPLWKNIIEESGSGICVDPLKPKEIADAINYLISHPKEAENMGKNGMVAVEKKFNWKMEEKKLLTMYEELLLG